MFLIVYVGAKARMSSPANDILVMEEEPEECVHCVQFKIKVSWGSIRKCEIIAGNRSLGSFSQYKAQRGQAGIACNERLWARGMTGECVPQMKVRGHGVPIVAI